METQQMDVLLSRVSDVIDSKLVSLEVKISKQQKQQHEQQMCRIQAASDKTFVFKRKGNEAQFKFNNAVREKTVQANTHINDGEAEAAFQSVTEGKELIDSRQKLVKLADSSKNGWRTVQEYTQHELASDEEDEKRIFKAEVRAEKKLKEERAQKARFQRRFAPYTVPEKSAPEKPNKSDSKKPGTCFKCGDPGHRARDCKKEALEKISTSILDEITDVNGNSNSVKVDIHANNKCLNAVHDTDNLSPYLRLKTHLSKWKYICTDKYVLSIIESGYKIPFKHVPSSGFFNNNKSARDNVSIVYQEIEKLIERGCITQVTHIPFVVNPLTVAFNKAGKPRLVLDCRHINKFIHDFAFRMEDTRTAREMFDTGYFLFSFDLKSAYHHIEIFDGHRKYLGFHWEHEGQTKYYVFNVLPFGISSAAFIFTKVLRKVIQYWRSVGIKVLMYLDDGLAGSKSYTEAESMSRFIRKDLSDLGFVIAESKCEWQPKQNIVWLGFEWNTVSGILKVTSERLEKTMKSITHVLDQVQNGQNRFHVRAIASITGQLISMEAAVGHAVNFYTRCLYQDILSRFSWNSCIELNVQSVEELKFWRENLASLNSDHIRVQKSFSDLNVYSDASDTGYGAYVEGNDNSEVIGLWTSKESCQSSTWRELESINRSWNTIGESIQGKSVDWHTDSKNVSRILEVGSRKPHLHRIAQEIRKKCSYNNVALNCVWIPRGKNVHADTLSRCYDSDDWEIKDHIFKEIDALWGPHTCDRFATDYNTKCFKFNSRWWCHNTNGVDAFKQFWGKDNNWLVPPPRLVCKAINKLMSDRGRGTLVIPLWKSAPFWPMLKNGDAWEKFVKNQRYFTSNIIQKGRGDNGIFGGSNIFNMVIVRLEFD